MAADGAARLKHSRQGKVHAYFAANLDNLQATPKKLCYSTVRHPWSRVVAATTLLCIKYFNGMSLWCDF